MCLWLPTPKMRGFRFGSSFARPRHARAPKPIELWLQHAAKRFVGAPTNLRLPQALTLAPLPLRLRGAWRAALCPRTRHRCASGRWVWPTSWKTPSKCRATLRFQGNDTPKKMLRTLSFPVRQSVRANSVQVAGQICLKPALHQASAFGNHKSRNNEDLLA